MSLGSRRLGAGDLGAVDQSVADDSTTHAVLIESLHKPGVTATFCSFFVFVGVCLIVGLGGPELIVTRGDTNALACSSTNCTAVWRGTLVHMSVLHQVLYLEATIERTELSSSSKSVEFQYEQEVVVTAYGVSDDGQRHVILNHKKHIRAVVCPAFQPKCDPIVVFAQNFIHYHTYEIDVQFIHPVQAFASQGVVGTLLIDFNLHRVNSNFTVYEMVVKYAFLAMSLVVSLVYFCKLTRVPAQRWSYEQKWIGGILIGLMFFNNPLLAMEIYNPSMMWTGLSVIGMVSFLAGLLLFWLCIIDVVRTSADDPVPVRGLKFYMPKVTLLTAFWMVIMILYMFSRLQQERDPSFNAADDFHTFVFVKVLAYGIVGVYTLWLLGLICLAMKQLADLSQPFRVVFVLSAVTILGLLVCLFLGAYSPFATTSLMFMVLYGLTNVYVFTLAIAYMPWVHEYATNIAGGELEMGTPGYGYDSGDDQGLISASDRDDRTGAGGHFAIADDADDLTGHGDVSISFDTSGAGAGADASAGRGHGRAQQYGDDDDDDGEFGQPGSSSDEQGGGR